MTQIEVKDASLGYGKNIIVEGLTFSVSKGDYLCVVGENGAGKSTLVKALLGLLAPLNGSISFGDGLRRSEIGYLPQQTAVQRDFPASVEEIVRSGCLNRTGLRPFYNRAERAAARANMEALKIGDLRARCYRELSGGQQQRALLARALCATRKMLLLDEPVSGLDPKAAADMYALIEKINREGITILMISHDVDAAVRCASHVLHIQKRALFFGPAADYINSDTGKYFLGAMGGDVS
jgi:zinc transport system ATP-binding protein